MNSASLSPMKEHVSMPISSCSLCKCSTATPHYFHRYNMGCHWQIRGHMVLTKTVPCAGNKNSTTIPLHSRTAFNENSRSVSNLYVSIRLMSWSIWTFSSYVLSWCLSVTWKWRRAISRNSWTHHFSDAFSEPTLSLLFCLVGRFKSPRSWSQFFHFCWVFWNVTAKQSIRKLKQPRRRRQQKPHKFAYLTIKNIIFARFARAFFIFWHFEDVLVLSTTWNDLFCSCVDDVSIWWQMFNFVFLCPKRWFQFNSRIVRTHFSSITSLNNWKMIAETRSHIFRWRSRFRRRRVCLSSLLTEQRKKKEILIESPVDANCKIDEMNDHVVMFSIIASF